MRELQSEELKKTELATLKFIHEFCVNNNIKYIIAYGTLLGAVRHKGFIPWDDDIDICMLRDDYERFIKTFQSDKYGICVPGEKGYNYPFVKVFDKDTVLDEKETSVKTIFGVYVDIFPLDNFTEDSKTVKKLVRYKLLWDIKNMRFIKRRGFIKNFVLLLAKSICLPISIEKVCKRMNDISSKISNSGKVTNYVWGNWHEERPTEIFLDIIKLPFEDGEFFAPKEYDAYLTKRYGNYMQLPTEEQRISLHTFTAFSLND